MAFHHDKSSPHWHSEWFKQPNAVRLSCENSHELFLLSKQRSLDDFRTANAVTKLVHS
jgi:hypothetical protein